MGGAWIKEGSSLSLTLKERATHSGKKQPPRYTTRTLKAVDIDGDGDISPTELSAFVARYASTRRLMPGLTVLLFFQHGVGGYSRV